MRKLGCCVLVAFACNSVSCNGPNKIYPVSGKVTYKGLPTSGAFVFFQRHAADSADPPLLLAAVQEDGSFEFLCGSNGKGAPAGQNDVLIAWREVTCQKKGCCERTHDKLNGRYSDPKNPLLHAVVKAQTNQLLPFELADAQTVQKRR